MSAAAILTNSDATPGDVIPGLVVPGQLKINTGYLPETGGLLDAVPGVGVPGLFRPGAVPISTGGFTILLPNALRTSLVASVLPPGHDGNFNIHIPPPKTSLTGQITHKGSFAPVLPTIVVKIGLDQYQYIGPTKTYFLQYLQYNSANHISVLAPNPGDIYTAIPDPSFLTFESASVLNYPMPLPPYGFWAHNGVPIFFPFFRRPKPVKGFSIHEEWCSTCLTHHFEDEECAGIMVKPPQVASAHPEIRHADSRVGGWSIHDRVS